MRSCGPAQIFSLATTFIFAFVIFGELTRKTPYSPLSEWIFRDPNLPTFAGSSNPIKSMMRNSERLWTKTVDQRQKIMEQFGDVGFFPSQNTATHSVTPYSVWDLIPASYNCPLEMERIGRMGDGGKWICGMSRYGVENKPIIIYSFGVKNQSSFALVEQEMLKRTHCSIWAYGSPADDFGVWFSSDVSHRVHFTHASIASATDTKQVPPAYTIQDLMKMNGHDYIDILKIDTEYSEYNALSSLNEMTIESNVEFPIGQILVEFHVFESLGLKLTPFLEWFGSMEWRGLRPVWMELNLMAVSHKMDDGNARLADYTLINVKDGKNKLYH